MGCNYSDMPQLHSSPSSATYMVSIVSDIGIQCQAISKPVLGYCQLDLEEQTPVKF